MSTVNAIETKDLCKHYKNKIAVDHLNMTVRAGEFYCLLGVNGAGKTTTIRMLTCLTQPTSGDALLMGHSVLHDPYGVKAVTNVSPQETAVAPKLTVRENLEMIAGIYGCARACVPEMIADLGLEEYADKRAATLSGGWQRRLSIAMAMITKPQVLFLDEPAQGLDVIAQRLLWDFISGLKGKTTLILTTHDMKEAEALSDRVGILVAGHLYAEGTVNEICAQTGCDNLEDAFVRIATAAQGGKTK